MPAASANLGAALLVSPVRREIMDVLANLPFVASDQEPHTRQSGLTAADLATLLDRHVTTIRFHLDQLVAGDLLIVRDERGAVGRPRRFYAVNPGSLSVDVATDAYRLLATMLADAMVADGAMSAEDAGAAWVEKHAHEVTADPTPQPRARSAGAWLAKMGILVDLLERWGYAPSVRTSNAGHTAEVELSHCPLLELAATSPAVACGVHRGIIRGALTVLGEADAEVKLLPFVEPHLCRARITTSADFSAQKGKNS